MSELNDVVKCSANAVRETMKRWLQLHALRRKNTRCSCRLN